MTWLCSVLRNDNFSSAHDTFNKDHVLHTMFFFWWKIKSPISVNYHSVPPGDTYRVEQLESRLGAGGTASNTGRTAKSSASASSSAARVERQLETVTSRLTQLQNALDRLESKVATRSASAPVARSPAARTPAPTKRTPIPRARARTTQDVSTQLVKVIAHRGLSPGPL